MEEWLQDKGLVSALRAFEVCRVSHELPGLKVSLGLVVWYVAGSDAMEQTVVAIGYLSKARRDLIASWVTLR